MSTNIQPGATPSVDGSGNQKVAVTGAGSGGTSSVDKSTFTAGTSAGTPMMGVVNPSDTPADGTIVLAALDATRAVKVNVVAGSSGNAAASATGAAPPASADYIGYKDSASGNLTGYNSTSLDYDTGAGSAPQTLVGIALPASGGPVAGGTSANPLKVDPTGTTTQPVSVASLPALPANQSTNVAQLAGTTTDTNSGNKSAGTLRVVIATDQPALTAALKVDPSGVTSPVSVASLPLPTGAATAAKQPALGTAGSAATDVISVQGIASMTPLQVAQATAASLNATVVGTGTFATQATQINGLTLKRAAIAASSSGDNTIVSAVSGKRITVIAFDLSFSGSVNAKFTDGASGTNLGGLYYGVANSGAANAIPPPFWLFQGSATTALILNLSAAVPVGGAVTYWEF